MSKKNGDFFQRYKLVFFVIFIYIIIFLLDKSRFEENNVFGFTDFIKMMALLPPTFFLVNLLDVWVERETMIKLIGDNSKFKGNIIAFFIGTIGIGPLYMTFPIMKVFIRKGASVRNTFIFMESWATTKLTQIFFEINSLGFKYTMIRLFLDIISLYLISVILEYVISKDKNWRLNEDCENKL